MFDRSIDQVRIMVRKIITFFRLVSFICGIINIMHIEFDLAPIYIIKNVAHANHFTNPINNLNNTNYMLEIKGYITRYIELSKLNFILFQNSIIHT